MHLELTRALTDLMKTLKEHAPDEATAFDFHMTEFGTEVRFQTESREALQRDNCPKRNLAGNWIHAPQAD